MTALSWLIRPMEPGEEKATNSIWILRVKEVSDATQSIAFSQKCRLKAGL